MKAFKISSGQPYQGYSCSNPPDTGVITIRAGRHGTSEVADWFRAQLQGGQSLGINDGSGSLSKPGKLNFAFTGIMSFSLGNKNYSCNVVMGQGNLPANNWWIGGQKWSLDAVHPFVGAIVADNILPFPQSIVVAYTIATDGNDWRLFVKSN